MKLQSSPAPATFFLRKERRAHDVRVPLKICNYLCWSGVGVHASEEEVDAAIGHQYAYEGQGEVYVHGPW